MAKKTPKIEVVKLYEGKQFTPDEQCLVLTGMTVKEFAMDIVENQGGKYDDLYVHDENYKAVQKKKRARDRRAAGGW